MALPKGQKLIRQDFPIRRGVERVDIGIKNGAHYYHVHADGELGNCPKCTMEKVTTKGDKTRRKVIVNPHKLSVNCEPDHLGEFADVKKALRQAIANNRNTCIHAVLFTTKDGKFAVAVVGLLKPLRKKAVTP